MSERAADHIDFDVYFQLGETDKGISAYERAAALDPYDFTIWRQLARFYSALGREADRVNAIARMQAALSRLSENQAGITAVTLACMSANEGDVRSALEMHQDSVKRSPSVALAWFNFGVTLHRQAAFEPAKRCYDHALQLNPRLVPALLNRGLVHAAAGAVPDAYRDWRAAASCQQGLPSDSAARLIDIADGGHAGAVAIARDVKTLAPSLNYVLA